MRYSDRMLKIAVTGAEGRMGSEVRDAIAEKSGVQTVLAVDQSPTEAEDEENFQELISEHNADIVIDFTTPEATLRYAEICAGEEVPLVTGTTGLSEEEFEQLEELSLDTAILHASNFSQGIQALRNALQDAVSSLPGYDIEIVETHHNRKTDAPSGTAKTILEDVQAQREVESTVHGREGEQPRDDGEIGVHAVRAGNVRGEHRVIIAGNDEVLSINHRSESRQVFAQGAIEAAEWLVKQDKGFYSFEEVLE